MSFWFSIFLICIGIFLLRIAIDILLTPKEVYNRNHKLTKQMKKGFVDSKHVETLFSTDTRTGELCVTQQIKKESIFK